MGKVHASLFSGFGAADLAATWLGWDNAFWCEIEDFPRTVLSYWFPKSKKYANIKETDFTEWNGKIDVLTGGFPCQPFSVAGQRKGSEDDRYLWPEMLRAIREIRPTWIIGENVGGITSMVQPGTEITVESQASLFEEADKETLLEQEHVTESVCRSLEQEGYSVQPIIIPACAIGAPHRRDRVWFIANSNGERCDNRYNNRKKRQVYNNQERDSTEDKSEWSERQCRACKDCKTITDTQCPGSGQIQQEIQSEQSDGYCIDSVGNERDATNTNGQMLQKRLKARRWQNTEEIRTGLDNGTERFSGLRYAPYTKNMRFQECYISSFREETGFNSRPHHEARRDWQDFPTQSPICRGNDGLPFDVVRLTIPFNKWREGSVKGYGNAIVPGVIYEIFKAIETIQE